MTAQGRAAVVYGAAPKPRESPSSNAGPTRVPPSSGPRGYFERLHVPMVIVLSFLVVSIGAIGFGLRPGTDVPPTVLSPSMEILIHPADDSESAVTAISVDETLYQRDARTVVLELDIFGKLSKSGKFNWHLTTNRADLQPHSCGDPYDYVGKAHPTPFVLRDISKGLTLGGAPATDDAVRGFVGRPWPRAAANTFALDGVSPGTARSGELWPIAKATICWTSPAPLAFDGEYFSANLPAVQVNSDDDPRARVEVTRSLYLADPALHDTSLTAQYSLQAGALPTTTDPYGWYWAADPGRAIQLTGISLPESQHEAYLGFVSGVLLGIAGGALVSLLQTAVEPLRRSPKPAGS